jgi:hypothetical protein
MTTDEMERVLETLDRRLATVEQILPTLATKADLDRFATKQDLREGLDGAGRHAEVLSEVVRDDIRLVAEGLASLIERLERKGII